MNPLLVCERRPDVVRLSYHTLVWSEDDLRPLWVQMKSTQDKYKPTEACEALNTLLPVVVQVEEKHLWLGRFENPVAELLNLQASLERELQLAALDNDVWEVEAVHLERVQHALARHNYLLWLFFNRKTSDQCSYLLSSFPLCQLTEALLASPDARVDDLEEELT